MDDIGALMTRSLRWLGGAAVFVAVWDLAVRISGVSAVLLPPPIEVVKAVVDAPQVLLWNMAHTVLEALLGFTVAVILGVLAAVGIVYSRFLERALYSVLVTFNSIPKVAVAPLLVIWLGIGLGPKVAISLIVAIFPIVIDCVLGLRSVEPEMLDLARSLGGSRWQVLMRIRIPTALPSLFAGMKVAVSLALVGAIVAEFVAADRGLGYLILTSQGMFDTAEIFAALVVLGLVGTALFYSVDMAERILVPWHVSRRREEKLHTP